MSFMAIKLFKLGYSQAKKQRAKKQQQQQFPESIYPQNPQSYPMEYPPNLAPGSNISYPRKTSPKRKALPMLISALRFFQFVFGLAVIGLYGQDVQHDHAKHTWSAKWVFALIVGFLATLTAMIYMIVPFLRRATYSPGPALRAPMFAWEFVLCVLWLTLFGVFGKMYIGVHEERVGLGDESKVNRMRHSVWVDLVNLGFWVVTASWVLLRWLKARRAVGEKVGEGEGV
ncbi:hypothetical protein PENDEC_c015G00310 [Penicillium decumbens]|uniref:MARVEL domain-containing protein n=1 Tax=Penicillium decumbens TaxID=69771 RepID=A0A1V6P988_PENDC|nr:hypothetical protein PENDEC_c015G00310 [Penicillium decumbens]